MWGIVLMSAITRSLRLVSVPLWGEGDAAQSGIVGPVPPLCVPPSPHCPRQRSVIWVCYVREHDRLWGLGVGFQEQVCVESVQTQVSGVGAGFLM